MSSCIWLPTQSNASDGSHGVPHRPATRRHAKPDYSPGRFRIFYDGVSHRVHGPKDLSFLGTSPASREKALQDLATWNCSDGSEVPSMVLRRPGGTGVPLAPRLNPPPPTATHKRKRRHNQISLPDLAAVGGYGPMTEDSGRVTVGSYSIVKLTERKNSAYGIWVFVRGIETEDQIPIEQWPGDYDRHLSRRPDVPFVTRYQ